MSFYIDKTQKFDEFFRAWCDLDCHNAPQINYWDDFFCKWNELNSPEEVDSISIDNNSANLFFTSFSGLISLAEENGCFINIFEAINLGRDEVRNCKILAWLLDQHGNHGQKQLFLEELLKKINFKDLVKKSTYTTRTESLPLGDTSRRIDIEIESSLFVIGIEVKINAKESDCQVFDYMKIIKSKAAGNRDWVVFYLTIDGEKPGMPADVIDHEFDFYNKIKPIKWSDIYDIASLLGTKAAKENNFIVSHVFHQYAEHVKTIY